MIGAILLTGYLGGATATHVRVGDPIFPILFPSIVGVLIWGGLFLRDKRPAPNSFLCAVSARTWRSYVPCSGGGFP